MLRVRPVWCHTCDQWLMPWEVGYGWGGSLIHGECADAQLGTWELLDALVDPLERVRGSQGIAGPRLRVAGPWRRLRAS